ncbi:MAG: penicillin acylase family protein [Acidobacteria bacterium]|nr:MAG: penicillin acylase family protein [Acidobacteriota bacterium]
MRRAAVRSATALAVLAGAALLAAGALRLAVRGSLPPLDGSFPLPGLEGPARLERDRLGIAIVTAENRRDAARALGFAHGQDRFFQMDLLRRAAAGELAALIGSAGLPHDRVARAHRLRRVAERALAALPPSDRRLIEAYADGVNAGLATLRVRPWEYLALRVAPEPWRPQDCFLALAAMFLELEDEWGRRDVEREVARRVFPPAVADFLLQTDGRWSAPVLGEAPAPPAVPDASTFDLRSLLRALRAGTGRERSRDPLPDRSPREVRPPDPRAGGAPATAEPLAPAGSNGWLVSGRLTQDGRALLANDMHLGIAIPNTWYRAVLRWKSDDGTEWRLAGVTLPGTPFLVSGSNGRIAWGFTAAEGDYADVVILDPVPEKDPADRGAERPERWLGPDGPHPFDSFEETIAVAHGERVRQTYRSTPWGAAVRSRALGALVAVLWDGEMPDAYDTMLGRLETASSVEEALDIGSRAGLPHLNLLVADAAGHIGWTITGRFPRRIGATGPYPVHSSQAEIGWDGWLPPGERPRLVDPASGLIWSANNRMARGEPWDGRLGPDGAHPVRAWQIRDRLERLADPDERAMLAIQLDDRADLLLDWRPFFLRALDEPSLSDPRHPRRREFFEIVRAWDGRAAIDSPGFRLLRGAFDAAWSAVRAAFNEVVAERFPAARILVTEPAARALVARRPLHLLDPEYDDWDAFLLAAVDRAIAELDRDHPGEPLAHRTWGEVNRFRAVHPIAARIPLLSRWASIGPDPLPGWRFCIRVQSPTAGASDRLAVAPGKEEEALFQMPCGQSEHPDSPFFDTDHPAWLRGTPAPLLPGPPEHRIDLRPTAE